MQIHAAVSDVEEDESLMIPFECIFLICAADLDSIQSHMDAFYGNCLFPLAGEKSLNTLRRTRSPALGFAASQKHKKFPPFSGKKQRGGHVCRRHGYVDTFVLEWDGKRPDAA